MISKRPPAATSSSGGRRRASHSMEAVLTEAVALLDEAGESALTFRALAARLGGGVGSIYWYVSSKDELLDRAADHVLADVLVVAEKLTGSDDPIDDLRAIAMSLFAAIADRPWLGSYFMRNTGVQPHGMKLYELIGEQTLRLDLTQRERFHAVAAIIGYVVGIAADMGQQTPPEVRDGELSREEYLARFVAQWRALDADEYPFVHHIVDDFEHHDDADEFSAGLDLLLAGLRLQAEA